MKRGKDKTKTKVQRKTAGKQKERLAKIYTVIALRVKMLDKEICLWFLPRQRESNR